MANRACAFAVYRLSTMRPNHAFDRSAQQLALGFPPRFARRHPVNAIVRRTTRGSPEQQPSPSMSQMDADCNRERPKGNAQDGRRCSRCAELTHGSAHEWW
jgi:hypothetical protein